MSSRLPPSIRVRAGVHGGRAVLYVDDVPRTPAIYSPRSWDTRFFHGQIERFAPHRMGAYFISTPQVAGGEWADSPWWAGDRIETEPFREMKLSMDEQAGTILNADPDAYLLVRTGPLEPPSWQRLHPEEMVLDETGKLIECPSLASQRYRDDSARFTKAIIRYCESRPWSSRLLGYWNGLRNEGTHWAMMYHRLYDHGPAMQSAWRAFLKCRYETVDALRDAHQDATLSFETAAVPTDPLLRALPDVMSTPFWQPANMNRKLRDYLQLLKELFHAQFRALAGAGAEILAELGRERVLLYDGLKQTMQGWSVFGFYDLKQSWYGAYAETMAGSGHIGVAELFDQAGFDGIITPHDYHVRGIGGVFEPEGCVDSAILRGKAFLCEMDTRTYTGDDLTGRAENDKEFAAITWRNLATSLTRGFTSYWMDLHQNWFTSPTMHPIIEAQVRVVEKSVEWPRQDVPGIAMVIDDAAAFETSGNGAPVNEMVMTEWRTGLAHCGVPYRIYLLEDLALGNFPGHRVIYFPNLFKVDQRRRDLVSKVLGQGRTIVWGPGSGISDGTTVSPDHATRLTGFVFDWIETNEPRRVQLMDFSHPITRDLPADLNYGSPLSYGPCLYPKDGQRLGQAWAKQGRMYGGLNAKQMDGWTSVFTAAAPIPAGVWRGLARHGGAHVWCDENDIILADSCVVGIHSVKAGARTIRLPFRSRVIDLINGETLSKQTDRIDLQIDPPQTRLFRYEPA